jgi:hypothetical protein
MRLALVVNGALRRPGQSDYERMLLTACSGAPIFAGISRVVPTQKRPSRGKHVQSDGGFTKVYEIMGRNAEALLVSTFQLTPGLCQTKFGLRWRVINIAQCRTQLWVTVTLAISSKFHCGRFSRSY